MHLHLRYLHELVVVVMPVEEGFLLEDHTRKHAAERPQIESIVILLKVHQQLGTFEVARRHSHVVLTPFKRELGSEQLSKSSRIVCIKSGRLKKILTRVVELCETPVNQP